MILYGEWVVLKMPANRQFGVVGIFKNIKRVTAAQ